MNDIRWGIIGTGNICSQFAAALKNTEGSKIAAVASRRLDKAEAFAKRFDIEQHYGSYEELALDESVDVVYIGTPHSEHEKNVKLCLNHGRNVLCEKAFTLNERETDGLIQLAAKKHLFLMEAMWTKFHPVTKKVKEWIREGKIGPVRFMNISFGFRSEFDPNGRLFNPSLGGGALLDVGVYPITYAVHMMGEEPVSISSQAVLGPTGVDELNNTRLCFSNGAMATLNSAVCASLGEKAAIIGEKGKIVLDPFFRAECALRYDNKDNLIETFKEPFQFNGYEYEINAVSECIRSHKQECEDNPLRETKQVMHIMDEIRRQWGLVYPGEDLFS